MRPVQASDIYALGVSCIYLLTAKAPKDLPYDPTTGELIWEKHVHISEHFLRVLRKMLDMAPNRRYKTAIEVYNALDLEDHLESLANSMNNVEARASANRKKSDHGPDSAGTPSSPAARLAMAIRTRQQARLDSSDLQSGLTRGRPIMHSGGSSMGIASRGRNSAGRGKDTGGDKVKLPLRLDADSLQNYYAKGRRDFASHDLRSLSLTKANLANANFHQANLSKINLQGANLYSTNLGRVNLTQANLRDANLGKAYLSNADLEGADLRGADLSGAYLQNANLRGANLCGAILTGAKITEEQLGMARTNWMTIRPNGKREIW
jgi:serine/threonine-protein kinase